MKNKVDEIMKEYQEGIKNIDNKYNVREIKTPKIQNVEELSDKIKYEKELITKLEYEGEDANKDMIERAKARLQAAENERKEIEKNNEEKLEKYNKSIEKREDKVLEKEKMKRSLVVLPSGREVTMAEKDKMDKQELKDVAIRKLTQESKNISEELLKKDEELKTINKEMIDVDYEIRIGTERDNDKIKKRDELNKKIFGLRKEMKDLSATQEKCSAYLEELKAPTKEEKTFSEAWNQAYKDEQQNKEKSQGTQGPRGTQTPRRPQGSQGPEGKDKPEPIYKIEIGKKAKIIMAGGHEFNIPAKDVKDGVNLSKEQTIEILNKYIDDENSVLLAQQLVEKNELDTTVLNVIEKSGIDDNTKKEVLNSYFNKCLLPTEENKIDIKYNAKEMSKVNLWNRILKRELNNNEKSELLLKAKKAEELGIAKTEGEYKVNAIEKILGKFGGTLRLPEPSDAQIEAAYKYNENRDKENFKDSIKNFKSEMSKEGYKELKSLSKAEEKQNEVSSDGKDADEEIDL